jgi:hypothetical protein
MDKIEDICTDVINMVFMKSTTIAKSIIWEYLYYDLIKHKDIIEQYNDDKTNKLKIYLAKRFIEPCTPVGTIAAQSVTHGITQKQLSAFHVAGIKQTNILNIKRYLSVQDVLELTSNNKNYLCIANSINNTANHIKKELECLYMKDIIDRCTLERSYTPWWVYSDKKIDFISKNNNEPQKIFIVHLNKNKIYEHGIIMKNIDILLKANIKGIQYVCSPNFLCYIYFNVDRIETMSRVRNLINDILIKGNKNIKNITVESENSISSNIESSNDLLISNKIDKTTFFCNDIKKVYELYGISACRDLIYETLTQDNSIGNKHALLIADYMTWTGEPESFKKQNVQDEYGHLFDMYFERPKNTLKDWVISGKYDILNNPYTQLMIGRQKSNFDILNNF